MRNDLWIRVLPALLCLALLPGCSGPDHRLEKLTREVIAQERWAPPLPPKAFTSDGCSCWPDHVWLECCVEHDAAYWLGGSRRERKAADRALAECVRSKGYPVLGELMYYGVRAGGVYWLPTPFRWGFGWEYPQSGPKGTPY